MSSIQSTIQNAGQRGAHNVFANTPKAKPAHTPDLNPADLEICNDPIPASRVHVGNKYTEKFAALKMGQGLKVPTVHIGKVANSLRKWIADRKLDAHVRSVQVYPGCTMGRVWLREGKLQANKKRTGKAIH